MTSASDKVDQVFWDALQLGSEADRSAYLDKACGGDQELRRLVEKLLRAQPKAAAFLEQPFGEPRATADEPIREGPGTTIGPYKLLEQIGEGGFGVVFMAEQTQPVRRKVALKVLKPGMDTRQVVARFEAERQALALMDHPHIAHVFDGGETATGRPYFVMELVKGIAITDFCAQNHVSARERLKLFISVSQAVQHAHQKGIIHRDLKPSNILVTVYDPSPPLANGGLGGAANGTPKGVPKVIDFGVAKAVGTPITDETLKTGLGAVVGTMQYMSPEQACLSAVDIDTRSDIYSLGVVLYELLTGATPLSKERLRQTPFDEVLRIIREEEPATPSTRLSDSWRAEHRGQRAAQGAAGDRRAADIGNGKGASGSLLRSLRFYELDCIVMKALEKDRTRRYQTANDFALDVQRYLADEPVLACPAAGLYKFRKFARRNRGALAVAALLSVFLLVTVAVLAISNRRIDRALSDRTQAYSDLHVQERKTAEALHQVTKLFHGIQEEQKQTKQALYFHSVALADREWWLNNVDKAEDILDQCAVEHRDWEWHFLKRRCQAGSILYRLPPPAGFASPGRLETVAFSPDGERLAVCYTQSNPHDWGVRVWDIRSRKELLRLSLPISKVSQFAFSPDGRRLACLPSRLTRSGLS